MDLFGNTGKVFVGVKSKSADHPDNLNMRGVGEDARCLNVRNRMGRISNGKVFALSGLRLNAQS